MEIQTNLTKGDKVHDSIRYPSIEHQVFSLFGVSANTDRVKLNYEIADRLTLFINGFKCPVDIGKKGVIISVIPDLRIGESNYPQLKIPYNVDVLKKVYKFISFIEKVGELTERAKKLKKIDAKAIESFLKQELATDITTISYWNDNLVNGIELNFYIHPKGSAPADGVMLCFEEDGKIAPFWNGSTPRRSMAFNSPSKIEDAVGRNYKNDIESLKKKIKAVEAVQKKIDSFDPSKSQKFMELLENKKKANQLIEEYKSVIKELR